jgi:hypothetical protein
MSLRRCPIRKICLLSFRSFCLPYKAEPAGSKALRPLRLFQNSLSVFSGGNVRKQTVKRNAGIVYEHVNIFPEILLISENIFLTWASSETSALTAKAVRLKPLISSISPELLLRFSK